MRFNGHDIQIGVKGILNVMKNLNMLPEQRRHQKPTHYFFTKRNIWVRASTSGISYSTLKLGQHIEKNETLWIIKDPFGASESVAITSLEEGIIVSKNNLPLVHEGETLFQIAVFRDIEKVANHLKDWKEKSIGEFGENE